MERSALKDKSITQSLVHEAIIVSHLDPTYMGNLEVELLQSSSTDALPRRTGQLITVRYLSPFYGVTTYKGITENDNFRSSQQSYGFWAVPPDIGTKVLVVFAEGNTSKGYWIGCIQDEGMNFMTPGAAVFTTNTTSGTPPELTGKKLPVGEYNKITSEITQVDTTTVPKSYNNDFTQVLEIQGLLEDETRGISTSSARREVPSMVFGISTPGPLDKRSTAPRSRYGTDDKGTTSYSSRLGGSSFVMDDGDPTLIRATHAADGPPYYVNRRSGEIGGDETIPQNEGIRFRTRTGHQILLSNSEDLIYVGNSRGTAWIELTSDGKIDIFANDSISVYSEQDFNFIADRDINFDAGRNINMFASARWSDDQTHLGEENIRSGEVTIQGRNKTALRGGKESTTILLDERDINIKVNSEIRFETTKDLHLKSSSNIYIDAGGSIHTTADQNILTKATNRISLESTDWYTQVNNDMNIIVGSNYRETIGANKNVTVEGNFNTKVKSNNNYIILGEENERTGGSVYTEVVGNTHSRVSGSTYSNVVGDENSIVVGSTYSEVKGDTSSKVTGSTFTDILGDSNLNVTGSVFEEAKGNINTKAVEIKSQSSSDFHIKGANINLDSTSNVNTNTGAAVAPDATSPAEPAISATSAETLLGPSNPRYNLTGGSPLRSYGANAPGVLKGYPVPRIIPGIKEPLEIITICTRVPQHEPWPHHENLDPVSFKPEILDRELSTGPILGADKIITPDTFLRSTNQRSSILVDGSGGNYNIDGTPMTPGRAAGANGGQGGRIPITANPDGSISRGTTGPNFQPSIINAPPTSGSGSAPNVNFSGYVSTAAASGPEFGTSQGVITGIRYTASRKEYLDPKMEELLIKAARYAKVDIYVTSPGQPPAGQIGTKSGTYSRIGSVRHNLGYAADLGVYDEGGRQLTATSGNDLGRMVTFVRAFRDYARAAGERPSGGVGPNYMNDVIHLDIAHDNSLFPGQVGYNTFAWGDNGSPPKVYGWMKGIMYGAGSRDGFSNPDGSIIGLSK